MRTEKYKYIQTSEREEQLYDICQDPLEQLDISSRFPNKLKYFHNKLKETVDLSYFAPKEIPPSAKKKEIMRRLQELGYM